MNNIYSDWYKIDLHIHTDFSKKTKENDYKGIFNVDLLYKKLQENQVAIFSLTDHNILNVPAYKEYYNKYNSPEDPKLLIGVELDIERDRKTYHSILVFNYPEINNVESISRRLEYKYIKKKQNIKERRLTIDEIVEIFPEDDFFFIPHAGDTKSIKNGYKDDIRLAQQMILLMQSALEKVPQKAQQKYNEGFNKVASKNFKSKEDIAYIEFSDNHNISKYPCRHTGDNNVGNHDFYYIKGSKSYETLRLAFIDPKSRLKSQEDYSKINNQKNYIESFRIEKNGILEESNLFFSPYLNVIIGGRSSGKSLLFNLFSKKIDKLQSVSNNDYDQKADDKKVFVKSRNDSTHKSTTSILTDIIYIKQGDIVNYFEKNKLEDLAAKLGKKEIYKQAKNDIISHKAQMHTLIKNLVDSYRNAYDSGANKKYILHSVIIDRILSKEFIFKCNLKILKGMYANGDVLAESVKILESLSENVVNLKKQNDLYEFKDTEIKIIAQFNNLINRKTILLKKKITNHARKICFIDKIKEIIGKVNESLNQNSKEKCDAQNELLSLQDQIGNYFKKVKNLNIQCDTIEKFNYEIKHEISLDNQTKLILGVEKHNDLKNILLYGLNNSEESSSIFINILSLLENKTSIKNYKSNIADNLQKKIDSLILEIDQCLDNPLDYLQYEDGSTSKNNSPGYNSEKYLEMILYNPTNDIIFIDQPEDNLGNKFIAERLVNLFRDIKFKKQIFLVTHNPAIVVYGDAESIIIAENNENIITYKQIVLEDQEYQKEICQILDGGEYIFDNRAKKYNVKRLLNER